MSMLSAPGHPYSFLGALVVKRFASVTLVMMNFSVTSMSASPLSVHRVLKPSANGHPSYDQPFTGPINPMMASM
ncbi:hypothetical protein HH110_04335 [Stenotrophomonas sp. SAM-B]|uniref:hypothetical protein n=1 Tax=Stenotrophomonas sp. SAM-B TaxID=2729141 RepID=UPI0015A3EA3F|nr:hypothetical protein [Stenotrophomonas sp. SAM-B]NWF32275.1 hypothetical protein [Stenotrophomonas sp. SAM-B]